MPQTLDYKDLKKFLIELSGQVSQAKSELNSMGAACGDGEFGSTMATAFENGGKVLHEESGNDLGVTLTSFGSSILSSAIGAFGPTVATLFTEAGKQAKGKHELSLPELASMLDKSAQKIQVLGGGKPRDKTLVDALLPAVNELKAAADANAPLQEALDWAAEAARVGCESTKGLIAKHGKARYLGKETLGFVDPGVHLISLIFATLAATTRH